jgi:DAACS family dicarboxylate/amino acid:cation (Na+ or H+) symporter
MRRIPAHWRILAALALATGVAMVLRRLGAEAPESASVHAVTASLLSFCRFVGELFMRALKMLIVPLVVTSVVTGITGMRGVQGFGRLGVKTALTYLGTGSIAILLGLTMVNLLEPGLDGGAPNPVIREAFAPSAASAVSPDAARVVAAGERVPGDFLAVFRSMLPENIVHAATDNGQLLGLIVFGILFAVALTRLPEAELDTVHRFFRAAADAMVVVTGWVMALAPFGVFVLILPVVYETGAHLFVNLGKYFATVLLALALHLFVVLPLILRIGFGVNPWAQLRAMRPALLLAFSTASSAGTLPVTLRCVEQGSGVSRRVTGFTLPLGATVNTDGTALYECVAVIFVAQVMGVELGFAGQFFVVSAALLTSIGVAGIPSASLVAILLILKSSGIPGAEAAVVALLSVDRLLDMSRTAVNVFGDSCVAVIVAKSEGETLRV